MGFYIKKETKICAGCGKEKKIGTEINGFSAKFCFVCKPIKEKMTHRICEDCGKDKQIPEEIYQIGDCYDCQEKRKQENELRKDDLRPRPCKKCRTIYEVPKFKTVFKCEKCTKEDNDKINMCKCGRGHNENGKRMCAICREERKNKKRKVILQEFRDCRICKRNLDVSKFNGIKRICIECENEEEKKKNEPKTARCHYCKKDKIVGVGIKKFALKCFDCKKEYYEKRFTKKTNIERECIDSLCKNKFIAKKSRATQSYCPECQKIRKELRKQKLLRDQQKRLTTICIVCEERKEKENCIKYKRIYVCKDCYKPGWEEEYINNLAYKNKKFKKICQECEEEFWVEKRFLFKKTRCDVCIEKHKIRHRRLHRGGEEIYKNGCFGYCGICTDGHKFSSYNEQDVDEWLFHNNVKHIVHPKIENSKRLADQYLPDFDLYIEVDGLDREDDIDWGGKISSYEQRGLKYIIIKPVSKHFYEDKEKCFEELDKQLRQLICLPI
jgi:hypothetical protein